MLALVLLAYYLFQANAGKSDGMAEGRPKDAAVLVKTALAKAEDVPITINAIGNVEALETVAVQPQIGGQLTKAFFSQGDVVKKGQLLFEIDPRLQSQAVSQASATLLGSRASVQQSQANAAKSAAAVQVAKATLQRDQAQLTFARAQEERYRNLLAKNYVTREQYDQIKSALGTAEANIAADQAAIVNAQAQLQSDQAAAQTARANVSGNQAMLDSNRIQLGFTRITAPVTGKTGPLLINVGNIVQPNTSTLVSIARLEPILVAFSVPEKYLSSIQKAMGQKAMGQGGIPVTAATKGAIANSGSTGDAATSETGKLAFVDNTVDVTSGTIRLKAEFQNTRRNLWPGRYVSVTLQLGVERDALILPAVSVQKGQQGDFVYVIQSDGRAQARSVVVDRVFDGKAILSKGLKPGEEVVIDGQMRLAPNDKVKISQRQVETN